MFDEPENNENQSDSSYSAPTIKGSAVPSHLSDQPAPTIQSNPVVPTETDSKQIYVPRQPRIPAPPAYYPTADESAARARARRRRTGSSGSEWAWVIIAMALLGVVIIVGGAFVFMLQAPQQEQEVMATATTDISTLPTAVSYRISPPEEVVSGHAITLDDGYSFILEPWAGTGRYTILLMGMDRRPGETGLAYRTDTMIVVSIDPETNSIGLLSIPRDLFVTFPGYATYQRINAAMATGEGRSNITGPELAMQTVQLNLGIRIHEYILVDFQAVIGLVDAIGGIEVTIDYAINDPYYPNMTNGYDPFYLAPGTHMLQGYDALRFARTRHGNSDIDRAGRQQEVIYAIRDTVLNLNKLPELIVQAPTLLNNFEDNVYTGMSLQQMIELVWYIKEIPTENITSGVIDYRYLQNYETPEGDQVVIPWRAQLGYLMVEIFGSDYSE